MANKIGIVLALDGEKEFTAAIQTAKKEANLLQSELKGLSEEFDGQANSMEALTKKQKVLTQQQEAYQRKLDAAKSGQEKANKNYQDMGKRLTELKSNLENARKELQKMDEGTEEYKKQAKAVEELEKAVEKQTIAHTREAGSIAEWNKKVRESQRELDKSNSEIEKNARYLDEARSSADHCATSIDKMGREIKEAAKDVDKIGDEAKDTAKDLSEVGKNASVFGGVLAGNLASSAIERSLELAGQAVDAVKDSMYDLSGASADLAAKTGLSEEAMQRYRDVMTEIKGDNFGESYGDVADVMAEIVQIMGELDPSAMKDTAESAMTLSDTFDMDVNESIRAVDVMMKTMGVDAQTAFDLIAKGAQNGLDRSHELTDNITEYGQLWGQMGFSAEEMFSILENGLDSGAYNLDKVNDYVKEFGVSLADGRIEKNIGKFSDGTKKLFGQWKNGEASARDVFYSVINDLSEMTDQQEALTLASDTWSALGEDNAMQVITALDDVNTAYSSIQGTMDKLKETKYSDLESAVSGFGAAIQENILTPIAEKAVPAVTDAVNLATGAIEGVGSLLNPAKTEFETFIGDIETANSGLQTALDNAGTAKENALAEGEKIEYLGERLVALNDVENKSAAQRLEMDGIVQQLGEHIPQIAEAYDKEASKVRLAKDEIKNLITSTKELMVTQALQAQAQEVVNKLVEAQIQYDKANDRLKSLTETKNALQELQDEYTELFNKQQEGLIDDAAFEEAESSILERAESLNGAIRDTLGEDVLVFDEWTEMGPVFAATLGTAQDEISGLSETMSESEAVIRNGEEALEEYAEAGAKIAGSWGETGDAVKEENAVFDENGRLTDEAILKQKQLAAQRHRSAEAAEESADATEDDTEALEAEAEAAEKAAEKAAEAAKAGADAQREALQGVRDEFNTLRDDIQQATDSKISLFDAFDGGEEVSLEDMRDNMASYADGIKQYYADLETLSKDVGNGISQEFFQYLSDLGPEGANVIHEITEAWTSGSEEDRKKIQDMMYDQLQALDASEHGAEIQARNQTLINEAFNVDPPDPSQYDGLYDALNDAIAYEGAEVSADVQTAFSGALEAARKVGADIPDGIEASISEGNVDAAVNALNGSVQGKLEGLAGIARDAGVQIPEEVTAGIQSGDIGAMAAAYDQLVSAVSEGVDTSTLSKVIGDAAGDAAPEIERHSGEVSDAMGSVAQAGADAADEKQSEFKTAGDNAAGKYVEALRAHQQEAAQAAGALASAAQNAVMSYRNAFETAGYYISAAVASGISYGASDAINAARNMAARTLAAAKAELDIHSPSKKFRQQVGQNISESTAFGISDKASLAGNEAAKMSAQVYSKATAWLSKYKKSHEVSLDDEQYYWDQVLQHVKKGTAAYNNAIKKLATATFSGTDLSGSAATSAMKKIEANFGVSRTKTTGSGKNQKTVKKDAEAYYSEIYSAANKYLSNMQTLNDWSLQAELQYWTSVQAQLKKGTQAWYDAQKQINSAKDGIAEAQREAAEAAAEAAEAEKEAAQERIRTLQSVHSKMLSQYKTYNQVSAKAEMEYWDIARQQFQEGTDARIEADQAYFDAREEYYDQLAELDEDYAEKKQDIDDDLAKSIKDLQDAYDDAVKSREQEIRSSMGLFDAWDAEGWDSGKLMANLKTQVEGLQFWEQQLDELAGKGVTQELMDELAAMGPDAAANLWSLNQMTAEQLEEYQKLWADKNNLAHKQALEDNKNLLKETQDSIADARKTAQEELAKIDKDYRDAVAKLNTGLSDGLKSLVTQAKDVGEEIVSSLVDAVRKGMTDVTALVTQAKQQAASQQAAPQATPQPAPQPAPTPAPASTSAPTSAPTKDEIMAVIKQGKKRSKTITSKEKESHSTLWQRIVKNYGYAIDEPQMLQLAALLGVSVSKSLTGEEKKKIRAALVKNGYASGARNVWQDELAWMLENAKTEYVVRTADKAILQPMRAGDKVINPKGAENLYDFAADPTKFISTRARDAIAAAQEAMQKRQDEMRSQIPELSYGGITRLNRLMESGMQAAPVVNVDNRDLVSMMQQMVSGMQAIMGQMQELQERQIVMDSGALVGALQQPMSRANAAVQRRRNRGTLR